MTCLTKEPLNIASAEEPYVSAKEAHISAKEPEISAKEPSVSLMTYPPQNSLKHSIRKRTIRIRKRALHICKRALCILDDRKETYVSV